LNNISKGRCPVKEFLFDDEVEDILKILGPPKIETCWVVVNAENYHQLSIPSGKSPNQVRDEFTAEAFRKGLKKVL
jgi:hypothetical protein